jgi:UDP-N-acetylmuramate dehydrogenase
MIRAYTDFQLKDYNTFRTNATAKYYFEYTEPEDLADFLQTNKEWPDWQRLILGGGSNMLFISNFDGLVINPNIPGIQVINEDRNHVWIEAGAGTEWDNLVDFAVFNQWGGIENLSLIPGKVGAAAVQNIGAYGMEIKDCIESVSGFDLKTLTDYTIESADCQYAYRDSLFKKQLKGRFIVTHVTIRLDKFPEFVLGYGDLKAETEKLGKVNLRNIRNAVINVRESKLPDPKVFGNAGSFFKNPVVDDDWSESLLSRFPQMPHFAQPGGKTKLAAGWLIEQCGWKGFRRGDAGVHEKQALVLVNYGNATGLEIYDLSEEISRSVFEKFGLKIEREVNIIGG